MCCSPATVTHAVVGHVAATSPRCFLVAIIIVLCAPHLSPSANKLLSCVHLLLACSSSFLRCRSTLFSSRSFNDISTNYSDRAADEMSENGASSSLRGRCTCGRQALRSRSRCGCTRDAGRSGWCVLAEVSWPRARTPGQLNDFRSCRVGPKHPLRFDFFCALLPSLRDCTNLYFSFLIFILMSHFARCINSAYILTIIYFTVI